MARSRDTPRGDWRSSVLEEQAVQPEGVRKPQTPPSVRMRARLTTIQQRIIPNDKWTELEHPLPSPSTSQTPSKEALHSSPTQILEQPQPPDRRQTNRKRDRERTSSQQADSPLVQDSPGAKRARILLVNCGVNDQEAKSNTDDKKARQPTEHWIQEGSWPKELFQPDPNMSQQSLRKNSSPSISYTQSVKDGESPAAFTPEYENVLAKAGIFMQQYPGQSTISDTDKVLCATLLDGEYEPPKHSLFQGSSFWMTLGKVQSRNEARVVRDITPSIVPSAELLFTNGDLQLQHLTEEISAQWTKCTCLAGPRPQPDFAVGYMSSAFADDEIEKLNSYTAPENATLFTGNLYFPFLTCEVKCGETGLNVADRQNAHSASIAVNAIVQLYRTVSRAEELHRRILVISVSHNHACVKIYGHYPLIDRDKTAFYRHLIRSFDFTELDGKERWTAYSFTRKVYTTFAPVHLERVRSVLADPKFKPVSSSPGQTELADSQETGTNAPSSQNTGGFKKPRQTAAAMLTQQVNRQTEQISELKQQNKQFMLTIQQQMDRQKEQAEENKKLLEMLRQRLG